MYRITHILGVAAFMVLASAVQAEEPEALEGFEGLMIGMTKAELEAAYPDGTLSYAGTSFRIEPRFGNFTRGEERFEGGLMIAELRPEVADQREPCLAFHDATLPSLEARYGEPDTDNRTEESDWAVFESNWVMSGNGLVGVMARFVDGNGKCDAKIAFMGSNMERF